MHLFEVYQAYVLLTLLLNEYSKGFSDKKNISISNPECRIEVE